jgi:predicted RNase H-like HicB family nuclease
VIGEPIWSARYSSIQRKKVASGWKPSLPGCFSQEETVEECLANGREAIESHVEALTEEGQEIPKDEKFVISRVGFLVDMEPRAGLHAGRVVEEGGAYFGAALMSGLEPFQEHSSAQVGSGPISPRS